MPQKIDAASLFVSTQWLADHLHDSEIRVFDASWHMPNANRDPRAEFLAEHICGAVFFDIDGVADQSINLPHMLPEPEVFSAEMGRLGFGDDMHAVIYDSIGLFSAPRLWWTFHVFGAEKVSILSGGLPAWKAEGRPLESGAATPPPAPRAFTPRYDASLVANAAQVLRAVESGEPQIMDARSAERFHGEAQEPRPGLRPGHMPGAKNVPFQSVIEHGRLRHCSDLDAVFAQARLDPSKPVIASCGSGMTACILSLAWAAAGHGAAAVYDGSWSEWGGREDLPVVLD